MNADDLSRVVMSTSLGAALSRARENARAQGHGEVTLEHMLMALCEDPDAGLVLAASNVDVMKLKSDASRYLVGLERQAFAGRVIDPGVSADLRRILDAAAAAARGGRRREINGAIVLAAIIGDGKSAASQMLQSQGLTFEGAIRALQRGASIAAPRTSTEDILASARERVQSRSVPVGMKPEEEIVEEYEEDAFEEPPEAPAAYEEPPPAPVLDYDDVPPTAPPRAAPPQPAPARAAPPRPVPPPPSPAPRPAPVRAAPPRPAPPRPAPPPPAPKWEPPPDEAPEIMSAPMLELPAAESEPLPEAYDYEQMSPPRPDFDGLLAPESAAPPPPPFPGAEAEPSWTPSPAAAVDPYATPRTVPPPLPRQAPPIPARAAPAPKQAVSKADAEPISDRAMLSTRGSAEPPSQSRLSELRRPMGIGAASSGVERPTYAALARGREAPSLSPVAAPAPAPEPRQVTRPAPAPRAELGQLVENIPRSMRVAVPALIEVRIARAEVQQLAEGLQGGAAAYKHEVTVTKAMSVRLRAPDGGFYIETASPETQWIDKTSLISNDDYASWRWHVTPREKGRRRLQLIISARTVSGDGLAAETALPDQVISVRVRTNYGKSFSRLIGWSVAAVAGGLIAKFGEGALTQGMQIVTRLMKG